MPEISRPYGFYALALSAAVLIAFALTLGGFLFFQILIKPGDWADKLDAAGFILMAASYIGAVTLLPGYVIGLLAGWPFYKRDLTHPLAWIAFSLASGVPLFITLAAIDGWLIMPFYLIGHALAGLILALILRRWGPVRDA